MFKKSQLTMAISAILAFPTAVNAADSQADEVIVVTATRSSQNIENTAASVSVMTDEELEVSLADDIEDVFKYIPGVSVQGDSRQGAQSINIRGMEGNRVKILIDNVSQANQFEGGGSFINTTRLDIDVDMLKSLEIVKGAASSTYGSDAIGGIVAFQTKDPADFLGEGDDTGGHIKLGYSSANQALTESVAVANRSGDLETLLAYTRKNSEERDNFADLDEQDHTADSVLFKLQYQINPVHRIEFNGQYNRREADLDLLNFPNGYGGTNVTSGYSPYVSDDTSEKYQIGIKHIWLADSAFADTLVWQLDYLTKKQNNITNRTSSSSGYDEVKDYVYEESGYQADVQIDKNFVLGQTEHFFAYGLSLQTREVENINRTYRDSALYATNYYVPDASEFRYGLFLQDEISTGNWVITPGIRYDAYKTDSGNDIPSGTSGGYTSDSYDEYSDSALTGRLGILYTVNAENKLFAQVSQGFRAPVFEELYYSYSSNYLTSVPNPDLEAEESISYELGWRNTTTASSTELSVFYSDYDNFITSETTGSYPSMEYTYKNLDKATIKGVELTNTLFWNELISAPEGLSSRLAAAYTEGEDGDGEPLDEISPWSATLGLSYDAPTGTWGTSIKAVYTSAKDESDMSYDGFAPESSTVVDLTAYYVPVNNLTLRAGVFNLTDEKYYDWGELHSLSLSEEDEFYSQPRRNFSVTAKYEF